MPVKMFYGKIGAFSQEKDMIALENRVNKFEKELKEQRCPYYNITMSSFGDSNDAYCIVHYDSK